MNIRIEEEYDGFTVIINGERFHVNQEDSVNPKLVAAFVKACPEAKITYEEVY